MKKTMFFLSLFLVMILLCLTQSSIEKLTINYQWGLHDKKKPHKDKAIYAYRNNGKKFKYNFLDKPIFRSETNPLIKNVNTGSYKCYYEEDEYNQCNDLLRECPIQNHPDLSNYILKTEIPPQPDMSNYILKTEIPPQPDMSEYIRKEDVPSLPDMNDYIHKNDIDKYAKQCPIIQECPTCEECPTCPVPIDESSNQKNNNIKKDKSRTVNNEQCHKDDKNKINFGDIIPSFMKPKIDIIDDFRKHGFQKKC